MATQITTVHLVRYHGLRATPPTPPDAAGPLPLFESAVTNRRRQEGHEGLCMSHVAMH